MSATAPQHALIIEDDLVVGLDLQDVLGGLGFGSFAFASTGRQAVEQANLRRPDLITADLELLDGDGRAACLELEAAWGKLPIIYVTGSAGRLDGDHGLTVVAKPFSPADIAQALGRLRGEESAYGRPAVTEL